MSINWQTSERTTGYVEYGNTPALGTSTPSDQAFMTKHTIQLTDLDLNTAYYYRVVFEDASGNAGRSDIRTFSTFPSLRISNNSSWNMVEDIWGLNQIDENVLVKSRFETDVVVDFDRSLVGWWQFNEEEDFNDCSTYLNNAINNGTLFTTSGRISGARVFDGIDNYIRLPDSITLQPTNAITVEVWMRPECISGFGNVVSMKLQSSSNKGVTLRMKDNKLQFLIGNGATMVNMVSSPVFDEHEWYHVVGRWDGKDVSLWVNGKKLPVTAILEGPLQYEATRSMMIGSWEGWKEHGFDGTIDEVRIWNRALLPEEIEASYNARMRDLSTFRFSDLTAGTYQYRAYAVDVTGNMAQTELKTVTVEEGQNVAFTINTTVPENDNSIVAASYSPSDENSSMSSTQPVLAAVNNEPDGGEDLFLSLGKDAIVMAAASDEKASEDTSVEIAPVTMPAKHVDSFPTHRWSFLASILGTVILCFFGIGRLISCRRMLPGTSLMSNHGLSVPTATYLKTQICSVFDRRD